MQAKLRSLGWALALLFAWTAGAAEWPAGFVIAEGTASPNGRYALLVPTREADLDDDEVKNLLVEVATHRVLGKLDHGDYIHRASHRSLLVKWAPDSSWGVVEIDERFSFASVTGVEIVKGELHQTELGEKIDHEIGAAILKHSRGRYKGGSTTVYLRVGSDRKLRVRALATTDPKSLNPEHSEQAFFQGTYDFLRAKWTVTDARSVDGAASEQVSLAFGAETTRRGPITDEKAKGDALDQQLNQVYQALRILLPADRFAKLKEEQLAWLKTRDAAPAGAERNRRVEARLRALEDVAWGMREGN